MLYLVALGVVALGVHIDNITYTLALSLCQVYVNEEVLETVSLREAMFQ